VQNFTATDNILQSATDFKSFRIVAPVDGRLPNGADDFDLHNVNPTINGVANTLLLNNFNTLASNYGNQPSVTTVAHESRLAHAQRRQRSGRLQRR
jgi:hypothetical protein